MFSVNVYFYSVIFYGSLNVLMTPFDLLLQPSIVSVFVGFGIMFWPVHSFDDSVVIVIYEVKHSQQRRRLLTKHHM